MYDDNCDACVVLQHDLDNVRVAHSSVVHELKDARDENDKLKSCFTIGITVHAYEIQGLMITKDNLPNSKLCIFVGS